MRQRVLALIRIGLGIVFIVAAVLKLSDVSAFAEDVANYRMVPGALVPYFACTLLGTELVAGLALVTGAKSRAAALVASVLLASFAIALSQALLRGIDTECGCFGGAEIVGWDAVVRDVAMLLFSIVVVVAGPGRLLPAGERQASAKR